jgi:hypothetical protein
MSAFIEKLVSQSTQKNTESCRSHPGKCLAQVVFDAFIIVALFALLTRVLNRDAVNVDACITFLAMWIPVNYIFKALDLEYSDQLARVAGWTLGNKLFSILTSM